LTAIFEGTNSMQIDFYNFRFEAARVTCHLWSPWRASALEHRLFNEVKQLPGVHLESTPDEQRVQIADAKLFKQALANMSRLLKGWQEEVAGAGKERRVYRWLIEADTDEHGYDHANEVASLWIYLRVGLDRGDLDEAEPSEWIDLSGFGFRFWPVAK
jgi:hypothetical protein